MKTVITICILIIFIGCGKSDNIDNKVVADSSSIHQVESKQNSVAESLIYAENLSIKLTDESIITADLEGNYTNPKFSLDGKSLFFTNDSYSQIWMYDIFRKAIQQISSLPGSGYKFSLSNDGAKIYFRNKVARSKNKDRINSIIEEDIGTKQHTILYKSENSISPPVIIAEQMFFLENDSVKCFDLNSKTFISNSDYPYLFVTENKLYKFKYGKVFNLNEKRSDYIDLEYSIDGKYVKCLTKTNGVEILDDEGNLINNYKEAVSLSILHNSNLVLFNSEVDDGVTIEESDLYLGFLNSQKIVKLENKNDEKRFGPSWSTTENKIAYSTDKGVIKIVSFNIEKN